MRYLFILALVGLAACGGTMKPFPGPNGRPAFTAICSPGDTGTCFQRLAASCQGAYDILDSTASGNVHTITAECRAPQRN